MSARDGFENDFLKHYYQNANIPNIGDATGLRGSSTPGYLWIALYTEAATDSSSGVECNYTGYQRAPLERSSAGFTIVGDTMSNASAVVFGQCVSGTNVVIGFTINRASGVNVDDGDKWGALQSNMSVSPGNTPRFEIGDLTVNID
jgi:hypothetical protein